MTPFLTAYFARIGWSDLARVNIETLRALHLLHNAAIPFENLDVLLPREMQLDDLSLEEKLVTARRGGYCFEQNGVFERALREIGFTVRSLLGRVVLANPSSLPPRTHRLLLVELQGEQWIADVGFGGQTLTAPIRLPDGGKLTLTNFHFTHYQDGHAVEQINLPDVASLYALLQERFGLGVDDVKHGFTQDELATVMAAFDTHPEAGK